MANGWKGVNQTIAEIRKFGEDANKKIAQQTQSIAFQIEEDAIDKAPKDIGKLAQTIRHLKVTDFQYKITVNEFYGAYMEFGTGSKINIPPEFSEMASTFKGKTGKSFEDGLEAIKGWCRRKGIDEKAAYPIFAKILGAGINPQPFLYPAYIKGKNDYEKNLNELLKRLKKKI